MLHFWCLSNLSKKYIEKNKSNIKSQPCIAKFNKKDKTTFSITIFRLLASSLKKIYKMHKNTVENSEKCLVGR